MMNKMNRRGQLTIINLIMILLILVVFIAVLPVFNMVVAKGVNETGGGIPGFLIGIIPLIIIIMIIMTALLLTQPRPPSAFG